MPSDTEASTKGWAPYRTMTFIGFDLEEYTTLAEKHGSGIGRRASQMTPTPGETGLVTLHHTKNDSVLSLSPRSIEYTWLSDR